MNRFTPDTWRDAILRPIAMAAPDAGVYVEIMAPDFRFLFIVLLVVAWVILGVRKKWLGKPALVLLGFVAAAFVPWLVTTGNGRYFVPILLAAGPLCVALIHGLPLTRAFRVALAVGAIGIQGFALYQNNPWHWWGLLPWKDAPFFEVTLDQEALEADVTYVTVSGISYSLIAPRFPPSSHWINLSTHELDPDESVDGHRAQVFLAGARKLKIIFPSLNEPIKLPGQPSALLTTAINGMIARHHLAMPVPTNCRLLKSEGLAVLMLKYADQIKKEERNARGFWVCDLLRNTSVPVAPPRAEDPRIEQVFSIVEKACPRFFAPGQRGVQRTERGAVRVYSDSDMRLYVLDDGHVYFKYWRALNPEFVGTVDDVLAGKTVMDCGKFKGRAGLPWERGI